MAQKIRIIGVPMDLGQSRRGVDMGPSALRVAGLQSRLKQLGHTVEDIGNVLVKQAEEQPYGEKRAKYLQRNCGNLPRPGGDDGEDAGRRLFAAGAGRRSFHRRRIVFGRVGFFSQAIEKDRLLVAGRAWRI